MDFRGPNEPVFPQSYLIDILKNARYATQVERSNFPDKWKKKVKPTSDDNGASTSVTGTGQQRGGKRLTQSTGQAPTTQQCHPGPGQGYHGRRGLGPFGAFLHGQWGQHPGGPYPTGYHYGGQLQPRGHMATCNWRTGWDDQRHPKIKDMMHHCLVRTNGCVHLAGSLMQRARGRITSPRYQNMSILLVAHSYVG